MSNCSNCYNGCTEIVSDRCVKYTGIDVPVLGIQTGDSLSFIEQALITFLTSTLDGTGIKIDLEGIDICALVQSNLPTCGDISIVDISKALIASACDLQEQVDAIVAELVILNGDYTINCLEGVTASSDTHAIVQAVINKLCQLEIDLIALALDLETNYVLLSDLDTLIQAYLDSQSTSTLISNRMVPYAVVEYYGPLSYFSSTGAGLGDWINVYLCNGQNGTPDKRGVVGVGITLVPGGLGLNPAVDPALGNPPYTLSSTIVGSNNVTLNLSQIPAHTHAATVGVVDPGHTHNIITNESDGGNINRQVQGGTSENPGVSTGQIVTASTGITVSVINAAQGEGNSHANYQPGLGCYYIQYRP